MDNIELATELINRGIEILTEGAVKTHHKKKLDRYLEKYNYKGDKKSGTIEIDGKTYKIDRNTNSYTMNVDGDEYPRMAAAEPDNNIIHLSKDFEKLKNNKRRDAVLQHEIGHSKLHSLKDKDNIEEGKDAMYDTMAKSNIFFNKNQIKNTLEQSGRATPGKKATSDKDKKRVENLEKYKKYENNGMHADRAEFEADAYASMHSNGSQLKRGVREAMKHISSDAGIRRQLKGAGADLKYISDDDISKLKKEQHKISDNDIKQRSKAAKDKSIDKTVYQESVEISNLLIETEILLNY